MEVNAVQVNNNLANGIDEQRDEQSLSPERSNAYNVFGDPDPDLSPRVGEEYQVEIPALISKSEYCLIGRNADEAESTLLNFEVGLPIPIIWIKDGAEKINTDPPKNECKLNPKLEAIGSTLFNRKNSNMQQETKIGMQEEDRHKGQILVPGSRSDNWTEVEEAGFVLGLYIFGKNLVQVKKFIGNKKMEDILSFYYGKFYKSDKYQRWDGCRKMKSRKRVFGQRIFTGQKQNELLSRLLPNVSKECQKKLLEASNAFVEGKMLLEEYVLTLKASVGINALVEGVGIGKGKQDLTGISIDSVKSTPAVPFRPEIPVGKACSMLSTSEIISYLTGDFRLSKARTSDLFWEAVWPRLLARGWHSEQPRCYNYSVTSKNPLVYLVPGVKKFSRKLVKGNHYFDSLSDVLNKVASDPELIDLEKNVDDDFTSKEGNGWTKDTKLDTEDSPADQPRHCYLKVKTPNDSADVIKFTVVDTSLVSEKTRNVKEMKSLPSGVLTASSLEIDSDDENTSEDEKTNESESVNRTCFDSGKNNVTKAGKLNTVKGESSDLSGFESKPSKEKLPRSNMACTSVSAVSIDQKTDFLDNKKRKDRMKCQSPPRMVSDNIADLVPITKKRRRLTACSRAKTNGSTANFFGAPPRVKEEEASFCGDQDNSKYRKNATADFLAPRVKQEKCPYNPKSSDSVHSSAEKLIPPQEVNYLARFPTQETKKLAEPLPNLGSFICRESVPGTSSSGSREQPPKPQPRTMIDLNLPVSPEVDVDESFVNEMKADTSKESNDVSAGTNVELVDHSEQQPDVQSRRTGTVDHSEQQPDVQARRTGTRNRPPTAKVLEAFAFGYLDKKEKRVRSRDSSGSKASRRVRHKAEGSSSGVVADSGKEERANFACNGNGSTGRKGDVLYTGFNNDVL
ncbi:uncharacterized protein LOC131625376 [Vicia villosa]|uniref:uncharacterized protein LOC131625376 n=1 Tax=Vicia villosa TaxID=3911 RepID=UPI00273CE09E|nr:uncharacterized protein LOC131625376 [Vicia villosa]